MASGCRLLASTLRAANPLFEGRSFDAKVAARLRPPSPHATRGRLKGPRALSHNNRRDNFEYKGSPSPAF